MVDQNKRAAEIDEDLKAADAKRRVDAVAESSFAEKTLDLLTKLSERMDAMEASAKEPRADEDDASKMQANGKKPGAPRQLDDIDEKVDEAERAKAQLRADGVAHAYGQRAPAPMTGEKSDAYRRRLLRPYQHCSKEFGQVDLSTLSGSLLDGIEQRIYADAAAASANPMVAEGTLLERVTTDPSGRQIRSFYGHPKTWMSQFMTHPGRLTRINLHPDRD